MPVSVKKVRRTPGSVSTISVAEAKSNFSALLNGVEKKHKSVTILRRGIPVAQIIPFPGVDRRSFIGSMAGTGEILGDIVNPYLDEWTVSGDE